MHGSGEELERIEIEEQMATLDTMDAVDRNILAAAILGAEASEVHSPGQVAQVTDSRLGRRWI